MPCGHLNAMRFAQKPLAQPGYSFVHVPKASSADLKFSSLQRIQHREHFQTCMAEMLLLGKEAVRRRQQQQQQQQQCSTSSSSSDEVNTNSGAKPLSLEYLADRLDIDDPCFGYLVRTQEKCPLEENGNDSDNDSDAVREQQHWQAGMLQGFITVTTFTNWQETFRWDSLHPEAYGFDPPLLTKQRLEGIRKWDSTGELAKELQATVRCGDVWNEGIVWPRIAEISLLGGLGCGRTLVQLVIEHLENLKATGEHNYDYVVLQATDNSIPFYESIGFVRVGGVMEDKNLAPKQSSSTTTTTDDKEEDDGATRSKIVSSPLTEYITKKRGETPQEIAKKLQIDVWDIVFLNKGLFVDPITPTSKLLLGTTLQVPAPLEKPKKMPTRVLPSRRASASSSALNEPSPADRDTSTADNTKSEEEEEETTKWHTAKENDTPRSIAKMYNVPCPQLIQANRKRLPGLLAKSRLKAGTQVQVSHFHIQEKAWTAYAHWSFPDDQIEDGEPSYMMVYKLNRRRRKGSTPTARDFPVQQALETTVEEYTPTPLLWPPTPEQQQPNESKDADLLTVPTTVAALETISEGEPSSEQQQQQHLPVLVARDAVRDALVNVKVSCGGQSVMPSPAGKGGSSAQSSILAEPLALAELKPPKRAMGPYFLFCADERKRIAKLLAGKKVAETAKILADRWQKAPRKVKQKYEKLGLQAKRQYYEQKEAYQKQVAVQQQQEQQQRRDSIASKSSSTNDRANQELVGVDYDDAELDPDKSKKREHEKLYNKIVKIKPEALKVTSTVLPKDLNLKDVDKDALLDDPTSSPALQPDHYKYWFVLTYIPDLMWCHLVPLVQVGEFTEHDKKPKLAGRPKWKLVDERLGQEIDISSRYVIPVKSRETKRCADADKEEWDIVDQDEEDVSSEEGSTRSARNKSKGATKRGRKRKIPEPSSSIKGRSAKKRVFESPLNMTKASDKPPSVLGGEQKVHQFGFTLPALDTSEGGPPTLDNTEASSMSDHSGSPPSPQNAPQCVCASGQHCPVHPPQFHSARYKESKSGPAPPAYHHPAPGPPPYGPPQGYYPPYYGHHMHPRFHRPPPPPGWPRQAPFPPPAPYAHHHQHGGHYPPPPHYYPEGGGPPPGYYPRRPCLPPLPMTPPGQEPSNPRLDLSVEREVGV